MGPGQRRSAREARTAPKVAEFGEWLQSQRQRISSKSRLGEKLTYIHRQWDGLQTFLVTTPLLPPAAWRRQILSSVVIVVVTDVV
nr:transposase [Pararhodobacter oceanensis]